MQQEISIVNDGTISWPSDTSLTLCEYMTDAEFKIKQLPIGNVPVGFQVEIRNIRIEVQ